MSKRRLSAVGQPAAPTGSNWRDGLLFTKRGEPKIGVANVLHVLSMHPAWQDVLAYDEFSECVVVLRDPPVRRQDAVGGETSTEWTEEQSVRTAAWFAEVVGFEPRIAHVDQAIASVARRRRRHPPRDYLSSLAWDGVRRLDCMLATHFGALDTSYTQAVGARWMISAVARVCVPGCQADTMLVLESTIQGSGKSTGLAALSGPEWFADTGISIGDKDSYQALRGKWIYEFGELSSLRGRDVERVKNFISARRDTYRPSYGRRSRDFLRQVVFCGTTNESEYLTDRTGNRRFWPVTAPRVDVDAIRRDRDQLWAEARTRFEAGEPWHMDTPDLRRLCADQQQSRVAVDAWLELIREWLDDPTVPDGTEARTGLDLDSGITTGNVLLGALDFRPSDIGHGDSTRVGRCMRELGWERRQVRNKDGEQEWRYFLVSPLSPLVSEVLDNGNSSTITAQTDVAESSSDGGYELAPEGADVERLAIQTEEENP